MSNYTEDLTGQIFYDLTVLEKTEERGKNNGSVVWKCQCSCGNIHYVEASYLRYGQIKSCGCRRSKSARKGYEPGNSAVRLLYSSYKANAKKRKINFNLSLEFFEKITKHPCYYCKALPYTIYKTPTFDEPDYIYNGVDRVDNEKGYEESNCVPCCWECNSTKKNVTMHIARKMIEHG